METIVVLHCSGSSGAQWRALAGRLGARNRVLAPDLTGYGAAAGWSGRGEFSLAQEAAAVRSLLGRLDEPVHLVGHSVAADARAALAVGDYSGGCGRFVDYWSGPGSWADMPPEKRAAFARQLAKVVLDFHALLAEPAELEDVCDIALPALLVQGGCTTLPSRCICARLRTALPEATFRVVQGAGHMLPITHRDEVNALIASHIEAISATASHARPARSREPAELTT